MIEFDYRLTIPSILSPGETYGLAENILNAADGVISADPASLERKQMNALMELKQTLAIALGTGSARDPQKEAKDKADLQRDTGFVRVRDTVHAIARDEGETDQTIKDAAALIQEILVDYPANVHSTKQDDNTALLDSLIPKLRAEPAAGAIATLGLTRFVDRMHEGNEQFKQAVEASAAARAEDTPSNRAAADLVRKHGSVLADNLGFLGATEEAYAPLAAQVRQFIDDAEAIARARRTRRTSAGADEPQAPPPETPSE